MLQRTIKLVVYGILCLFILAGCTQEADEKAEQTDIKETKDEQKENIEPEEVIDEEENNQAVEGPDSYKTDIGNLEVYIGGEVIVEEDKIIIEGESNLLPRSILYSSGIPLGDNSVNLGFNNSATIQEDGSFRIELPSYNRGIHINLRLSAGLHKDIKEHYGEHYENVTGPYKYKTKTNGEYAVRLNIFVDGSKEKPYSFPIEVPDWSNVPDDYGDSDVWIDVDVTSDHNFIYVHGKSNLIEGSIIGGHMNNPPGTSPPLVPLAFDSTSVNPDGSFDLILRYDSFRKGRFLPLQFRPAQSNWESIIETYGENGENLEGELVKTTDNGRKYVEKIIELDAIFNVPDDVDVTQADEEIIVYIPDKILFDFDESELKSQAKKALDDIIKELEELPAGTVIHINGHTDNDGDANYNKGLSERRAQSVYDYVKENGDVSHLEIEKHGFGETKPRVPNDSDDNKSKNRRVEIVINPQ